MKKIKPQKAWAVVRKRDGQILIGLIGRVVFTLKRHAVEYHEATTERVAHVEIREVKE